MSKPETSSVEAACRADIEGVHFVARVDQDSGEIEYEIYGPGGWIAVVKEPEADIDADGQWNPLEIANAICKLLDEILGKSS